MVATELDAVGLLGCLLGRKLMGSLMLDCLMGRLMLGCLLLSRLLMGVLLDYMLQGWLWMGLLLEELAVWLLLEADLSAAVAAVGVCGGVVDVGGVVGDG